MKKLALLISAVTAFASVNVAQAADVTAQALATWSAIAKKDTTSKLVVTPINNLTFQYAEGVKGFNTQNGLFDVTIEGDTAATAFKLTSRLVTNTLTQLGGSGSTLEVGVEYQGVKLDKTTDLKMIDTTAGLLGDNLSALSDSYNKTGRASAQSQFNFSIVGGTTDGTTAVTTFDTLPEGLWTGDVSIRFDATWTV